MHNIIFNWLLSFGMKLNLLKYYHIFLSRTGFRISFQILGLIRIRMNEYGSETLVVQCTPTNVASEGLAIMKDGEFRLLSRPVGLTEQISVPHHSPSAHDVSKQRT